MIWEFPKMIKLNSSKVVEISQKSQELNVYRDCISSSTVLLIYFGYENRHFFQINAKKKRLSWRLLQLSYSKTLGSFPNFHRKPLECWNIRNKKFLPKYQKRQCGTQKRHIINWLQANLSAEFYQWNIYHSATRFKDTIKMPQNQMI